MCVREREGPRGNAETKTKPSARGAIDSERDHATICMRSTDATDPIALAKDAALNRVL